MLSLSVYCVYILIGSIHSWSRCQEWCIAKTDHLEPCWTHLDDGCRRRSFSHICVSVQSGHVFMDSESRPVKQRPKVVVVIVVIGATAAADWEAVPVIHIHDSWTLTGKLHGTCVCLYIKPPPQSFKRWQCPSVCLLIRLSVANAHLSVTSLTGLAAQ